MGRVGRNDAGMFIGLYDKNIELQDEDPNPILVQ